MTMTETLVAIVAFQVICLILAVGWGINAERRATEALSRTAEAVESLRRQHHRHHKEIASVFDEALQAARAIVCYHYNGPDDHHEGRLRKNVTSHLDIAAERAGEGS